MGHPRLYARKPPVVPWNKQGAGARGGGRIRLARSLPHGVTRELGSGSVCRLADSGIARGTEPYAIDMTHRNENDRPVCNEPKMIKPAQRAEDWPFLDALNDP